MDIVIAYTAVTANALHDYLKFMKEQGDDSSPEYDKFLEFYRQSMIRLGNQIQDKLDYEKKETE